MNQILSVEMPKSKVRTRSNREPGKASTKSVVTFFCIILIIFGIALVALGIILMSNNNKNAAVQATQGTEKIRIDVSQNATEVEVEVFSGKQITKIEYSWNNGEPQLQEVNGTNNMIFKLKIPSGSNTLKITATDINGEQETYTKEGLIGEQEAKVALEINEETNTLKIVNDVDENGNVIEEEKNISTIQYHYDNEEEKTVEINDKKIQIEVPIKEGEHDLTIKLTYEDGETREKTQKVYFPEIKVGLTGNRDQFIIRIKDKIQITELTVNFNGQERTSSNINKTEIEGRLTLKEGKNTLVITAKNEKGFINKKTFEWDKK